jgi:hypothetical protein
METVQPHSHNFAEDEWPFSVPTNALAISTVRVVCEGHPVLRVSHDKDGIWQVLCNTTTEFDHCKVACLGCCYQLDSSIGEFADLPLGWGAWRRSVRDPWIREANLPECDDEA